MSRPSSSCLSTVSLRLARILRQGAPSIGGTRDKKWDEGEVDMGIVHLCILTSFAHLASVEEYRKGGRRDTKRT
jgi:hypothetical protein